MKKSLYALLFLSVNFGGLYIGAYLMDNGPTSEWYLNLNKAPWTPPGWVFGFSWTLIMICFSWYLSELFFQQTNKILWFIFGLQVFLNIGWNWIFFNQHFILLGFICILLLSVVVFYYFFSYKTQHIKYYRFLLLPYLIWICIATSLNGYILFKN